MPRSLYPQTPWQSAGSQSVTSLICPITGTIVTGVFSAGAKLEVTGECEHENCQICRYLQHLDVGMVLGRYFLRIVGKYFGTMLVQLPVEEAYEGQYVTVAWCEDGILKTMDLLVRNGYVRFYTDTLHCYVVLNGLYRLVDHEGVQALAPA